jgi:HEAT repeat protein
LTTKAIKLNYRSAEKFSRDYAQLRKGKIFIPAKTPLPLNTRLAMVISAPGIEKAYSVEGAVVKSLDSSTAARFNKQPGMIISLVAGPEEALRELNRALGGSQQYEALVDASVQPATIDNELSAKTAAATPPEPAGVPEQSSASASGPALTMDWIRDAIAQEEATREKEAAAEIATAPTVEKKQLSQAEREKVKPSGEFLMDLTKAMLRSGYYAADHPGAKGAKQGLYEKFLNCLGDSREIMITNQENRERTDILITGILDEPVNVRILVGAGMAELFVPKLREFFRRKGLVSFAIKKDITPEHFESFVDIMSDPKADSGGKDKIGKLLSSALVEHGITEISTVFMDDLIVLELNLPWRVEMAIQRLAKDLKVLPMFENESEANLRKMKIQIIQDILRPLKHPEFLKDLIINCYIIARHVKRLETEDIEKVIIEAFPLDALLPTSRFIFEELNHLREIKVDNPDSPALKRRFTGVKRILKWVSRRLVLEDVRGAQNFLEQLYQNQVLTFEELPADVQYLVNTEKMASDVRAHMRKYVDRILKIDTPDDVAILLKLLRRIMPSFIERSDWQHALYLTQAVAKREKKKTDNIFATTAGLPTHPLAFIFKDRTDAIVSSYEKADEAQRLIIDEIAGHLGGGGIEILSRALSECEDRGARKAAMEALKKKGKLAKSWVLNVLDEPGQKWFLLRNALMLLGHLAEKEEEIERARKLVHHEHPRVRDEALSVLIKLKASGTEKLVIACLDDADDKIRWRALNSLGDLAPLSQASIQNLLDRITAAAPADPEAAAVHHRNISQLIRALGAVSNIVNHHQVEDTLLELAGQLAGQKKGLLQRFKKSAGSDSSTVLSAVIATLGSIGTVKSEKFLEKLATGKSPQAEPAQKAANHIKLRGIEQLSAEPSAAQSPAPS